MRAITKPTYDTKLVYETAINSIKSNELKTRLNSVVNFLVSAAIDYEKNATGASLYNIQPDNQDDEEYVLIDVKKKELLDLYSQHMVGLNKPARKIYDELLGAATNGKCPSCGFGQASTLDHYLPKTKFPFFSMLPLNLVPACKDCNTGKNAKFAVTGEQQPIHPYYDHNGFVTEQWLFAEVEETSPISIRYYVKTPDTWGDISKERVRTHFNDFNLSKRFSVEAADELTSLISMLNDYSADTSAEGVRNNLEREAMNEYKIHKNSWKTAMYQALATNDWFCLGGYNL